MMSNQELKVALLQIRELYFTFDKINPGYIKAKVDGQVFHLWSSHFVEVLGVSDEGDHLYFDLLGELHLGGRVCGNHVVLRNKIQ